MWLKKYFVRKGEIAHKFSSNTMYNRGPESRWKTDHTPEVMNWLWKHKMIQWSKSNINLGESSTERFIAYTKLGRKIRDYIQ